MSIIFVDLEASSLLPGSWPVEIGWAVDGGGVESHLIRPPSIWRDWDPKSEAIHGISQAHLREHGEPVDVVAHRAVKVLGAPGVTVCSDAPGWDQVWLDRLLQEAGLWCDIQIHPAQRTYEAELRRLLQLAPPRHVRWHEQVVRSLEVEGNQISQDVYASELTRQRGRHRAGPDAASILWILHEVRSRVDARLAAASS